MLMFVVIETKGRCSTRRTECHQPLSALKRAATTRLKAGEFDEVVIIDPQTSLRWERRAGDAAWRTNGPDAAEPGRPEAKPHRRDQRPEDG